MNPVEAREQSAREILSLRWIGEMPRGVTYYPTLDVADQLRDTLTEMFSGLDDDTVIKDPAGNPIAFRYILQVPCAKNGTPAGVSAYQYHRLICRYVPDHGWMLVCMHCDSDDKATVLSLTPVVLADKAKDR